jgi:hypothetical protein
MPGNIVTDHGFGNVDFVVDKGTKGHHIVLPYVESVEATSLNNKGKPFEG